MPQWEVVGGADKGGILVREGQELKSTQLPDRLSTGAVVEQLELKGDRLHYKVITGTGPPEGWVSLKISGKELLIPKKGEETSNGSAAAPSEGGGPADTSFPVEVDATLKKKVEELAAKVKKEDIFPLCAMKYKLFGGPLPDPKFRLICFHNAGGAESVYSGPATDLAKWLKGTKAIEMIAVDYPGRDKLLQNDKFTDTMKLAEWLLAVVYDKIADGVPYMVWGHSVGTWVCFEFMMLARQIGLPMPKAAFLNAFPAPHMPVADRPWKRSKTLDSKGLKEQLMDWDSGHANGAGKVVFDEPGWKDTWEPLMRADFQLYDEYEFKHSGAPKFDFPLHCYHMEGEKLNKPEKIALWKDWTTAAFETETLKEMGHLTCFYKPEYKKVYFEKVMANIKKYTGL